jgi:hypothetical protein
MSSSSVCIASISDGLDYKFRYGGGLLVVPGRTPLPALYWVMDKVGGPESRSVTTGKPISSKLQHGKLIRAASIRLDCLVLHAKLSSRLRAHMSGRTGLLDRSTGLLVGRTYLSGTVVSLVGGDPGVPMSHSGACSSQPGHNDTRCLVWLTLGFHPARMAA